MYCIKCGNLLRAGAKFCTKCGKHISGAQIYTEEGSTAKLATGSKRLINLILDYIGGFLFAVGIGFILGLIGWERIIESTNETVLGLLIFFLYWIIFEGFFQRTPAKFITKTKVVMRDGSKPSFSIILKRTLCRFIPFEAFTFLNGTYPIGWHDNLSQTLVVPSHYSEEEVINIDLPDSKKTKNNGVFILVVIIFAIAIIGILASIVLAAFNTAKQKAEDAKIKVEDVNKENLITPIKINTASENVSKAVVNVLCPKTKNGGSGTIFTKEGIILTNEHVVRGSEVCLVTIPNSTNGSPDEIYVAQPTIVPIYSKKYDIALLEITKEFVDDDGTKYGDFPKQFHAFSGSTGSCENYVPRLGEEVKIYGYPVTSGGYNLTITDGIISSFSDDKNILTSAKIDNGNSGGLAINNDNCFVGIPSAVLEGEHQNLGVIISTELILEFLNSIDTE
jgi:uncharacterized RDD family membrane protein YckC